MSGFLIPPSDNYSNFCNSVGHSAQELFLGCWLLVSKMCLSMLFSWVDFLLIFTVPALNLWFLKSCFIQHCFLFWSLWYRKKNYWSDGTLASKLMDSDGHTGCFFLIQRLWRKFWQYNGRMWLIKTYYIIEIKYRLTLLINLAGKKG